MERSQSQSETPHNDHQRLERAGHGFWQNHSLSIILGTLFLLSWIAQGFFQHFNMAAQVTQHGQTLEMRDFWSAFFSATFENWQSEFLQLFTFVMLTKWFVEKGSDQSKKPGTPSDQKD